MLPAWGITPTQQIEPNFGPQRAQIHPCLSLEQLQEVIGAVRDQVPYPYKGIFLMLAMTGMRVSEVLKLQLEHLDWQPEPDGSTTLYLSVLYGKTGDRRIPVHSTLQGDMVDYLYEWRFKHHKKSKLVFPCRVSGGHITYNSFYTYAKPFMASLGFEGFKLHTFRRSWLTLMLQQGMSVPEISRYAGHSNIAITSRYLHIPPEQLNASLKEHANEVQL